MEKHIENMPVWKIAIYSMGQFGWSILVSMMGLVTYFYIPPDTGEAAFPVLISREAFYGLTVVGIGGFIGNWMSLISDPLFAVLSDRSKSRIGRRRLHLLLSALPFALLTYFLFQPPTAYASTANVLWLIGIMTAFTFIRSQYCIPFGALVPEIGHTSKDRVLMCSLNSAAWIVGFAFGAMLIFTVKDILQSSFGMTPLASFRTVVAAFCALGFAGLLMPALVVDEKRYCNAKASNEHPIESLKNTFRNKDWLASTIATNVYVVADMTMQLCLVYYVTIIFALPEKNVAILAGALVAASFLWYPVVNFAAARISKKKIAIFGISIQTLSFAIIGLHGLVPQMLPTFAILCILVFCLSIVGAITGILPSAIGADVVRADAIRTGVHKEAIFGAAGGIVGKFVLWIPPAVIPTLLLYGRSVANPFGVRLTAVIAEVFLVASIVLWMFYDEKRTIETLGEQSSDRGECPAAAESVCVTPAE
ncbi:MAG: MFS transporter [Spirochaetota bacterium]